MLEYLSEQRSGTRGRRTVGNVGYARYRVRSVLALYEAAGFCGKLRWYHGIFSSSVLLFAQRTIFYY